MTDIMNILGVRVDNLSREEILEKVSGFLNAEKFHQIATINPEFILAAKKNEEFKNILNNCDLNVADGFGIKLAFRRFGETLQARIAGIDLMEEILKIAEKNNFKIFLAANSRGLCTCEEVHAVILKKYPNLEISGMDFSCHSNISVNEFEESIQIVSFDFTQDDKYRINEFDIVFANFGAPYQEKFLNSLKLLENSKIRLAMGVGGSFDYLTGKIKRAPVFMRNAGLEWLWRLVQQPRRIKRIWNAVIIFPLKIIFSK